MKNDRMYLEHILESIIQVQEYIRGISKGDFISSPIIRDAVVRRMEIIGEAAKNVSTATKRKNRPVPWKKMAGMRDILIHKYFGVDYNLVWKTC